MEIDYLRQLLAWYEGGATLREGAREGVDITAEEIASLREEIAALEARDARQRMMG